MSSVWWQVHRRESGRVKPGQEGPYTPAEELSLGFALSRKAVKCRELRLAGSRWRVIGKASSEVGRSARRLCDRLWLKPREPAL